jgi:hypothetical protein
MGRLITQSPPPVARIADFRNVARARQRHPPVTDDARTGARRHDHDAVGQRDRLLEVVGDEQHRLAVGIPQLQQQVAHDLPGLGIERPERLVHQQDFGIADQHLREANPLALPARQHVRITIAERPEAHRGKPALRAFKRVRAGRTLDFQADGNIVDRGLPRKQRIGLKQIAGLPVQPCKRRIEDSDRSRCRFEQAGGDVQQRRFSASGGPDDCDELAMLDLKPGLFHRGIDPRIGQPKRHRGVVKRDRRRPCGLTCLHLRFPDVPCGDIWITAPAATIQPIATTYSRRAGLVGRTRCDSPKK